MKSLELLNAVQRLLIDFANKEGINLAADFGTPDEFKKFVIAFTFRSLTDLGMKTEDAYDTVFGSGEYEALASRVWNGLSN